MTIRDNISTRDYVIGGGAFMDGVIVGACLMAVLDPQVGRSRRAWIRQKTRKAIRRTGMRLDGQRKDLVNRTRGLMADTRSRMKGNDHPSDLVLISRIRSSLGHCCSHPGAIDVQACDGRISVWGPVIAEEADTIIKAVESVPGVVQVEDQLQRFSDPRHIPALQGGREFANRDGLISGGIGTLLGMAGMAVLGMAATRLMNLDMDTITDRFRTSETDMEPGLDDFEGYEEMDNVDQFERLGRLPEWIIEHEEHILLDRRR